MAKQKLATERRDSLAIVLRKLNKENVKFPKSLARLLDKKIYLEWTGDLEGQELFWRRLVEAIRSDGHQDAFSACTVNTC